MIQFSIISHSIYLMLIISDHLKYADVPNRLALELADQKGVNLPTAAAANTLYERAVGEQGLGDEDFSAVYKAVTGPK